MKLITNVSLVPALRVSCVLRSFPQYVLMLWTVTTLLDCISISWNGNECGRNYGSENLKGTVLSTYYDGS